MRKILKFLWILNLVYFAYSTPIMLWQNIFEESPSGGIFDGIPPDMAEALNKSSSDMMAFLQKPTPEQSEHFNHLLNQARMIDEILLTLFIIIVSFCFVGATLYWINHRDPENRIVRYVTANKRRIYHYAEAAIIFFWAVTTVTIVYPQVYELTGQDSNFQDALGELRK